MLKRLLLTVLLLLAHPATAQVAFTIDPALPSQTQTTMQELATRAASDITRTFGFAFPRGLTVIISGDPDFLARDYARNVGGNAAQKRRAFADWIYGEATFNRVYVNVSNPEFQRAADTTVTGNRLRMLHHEFFHVLQYQVVGNRARNCCPENSVPPIGPVWLMEGSAVYVSRDLGRGGMSNYLRWAQGQRRNLGGRSLSVMETRTGINRVDAGYEIGAYATHLLIRNHGGMQALIGFYQRLGQGRPWQVAFTESFGLTTEAFYAAF